MKSITIPVHSFVDLITNSSSEIYVSATDNTVAAVKAIIDHLLKSQGVAKTADELFTIKLTYSVKDYEKTENEFKEFKTEAARTKWCEENDVSDSEYTTLMENLVVKAKGNDPELKKVAESVLEFFDSVHAWEGEQ